MALSDSRHVFNRKQCRSHFSLAPRYFTPKASNSTTHKIAPLNSRVIVRESPTPEKTPAAEAEEKPPPDPATRMTGAYSLTPVPTGHVDSKCHEAGYDAMITAQVMLSAVNLCISFCRSS